MENKNISLFFEVSDLDSKNFSFNDLILKYYYLLDIYRDKKTSFYSQMPYLYFVVSTFSEIMKQTFCIEEEILCDDLTNYTWERFMEIKSNIRRDNGLIDGIFVLSTIIMEELTGEKDLLDDDESEILLTMIENSYLIDKVNKEYSVSSEEEKDFEKKHLMS